MSFPVDDFGMNIKAEVKAFNFGFSPAKNLASVIRANDRVTVVSFALPTHACFRPNGLGIRPQNVTIIANSQYADQALELKIDFSTALDQIAAVQQFLSTRKGMLPGLESMFGEAIPEEMLTITTDLDMTGAQARWDEFAANPGAITTEAIISKYNTDAEGAAQAPLITAFVSRHWQKRWNKP